MRKTLEQFIQEARKIHGNKYDYSKSVYKNCDTKIKIICPIHGEFEQTPYNHLHSTGCPKCGRNKCDENRKLGITKFIEKAKQVHGDKYDYSNSKYTTIKDKITIICPIHGEFKQQADSHIRGRGCPKCANEHRNDNTRKNTEQFITESQKIHNNKYDYSLVNYINAHTKVTIICSEHGKFEQTPNHHLRGCGCQKCMYKNQTMLYEKLKESFPNEKILFEVDNKIVPWLILQRFDIYFPKYNIAVEYNGKQHYVPVEHFGGELGLTNTKERDELKRQKCKENNCQLFEIKYDYTTEDYNNLVTNITNIINK